jgi:hypothetical protein
MRTAALVCALGVLPAATSGHTVVRPTGDPARDVQAVRAAVRAGGTVLLKATDAAGKPRAFDFGDFPVGAIDWNDEGSGYVALGISGQIVPVAIGSSTVHVSLGNDVRLLGETTGQAMTTIRGGTIPIRNFAPREVPGAGVRFVYGLASLTVEGIRFTESALQAMYTAQFGWSAQMRELLRARGLSLSINIRRNEFVDVQPAYSSFWYALGAVTDGPAGAVRVEDNLLRFTPGRWDADERAYEAANGLPPRPEIWEGFSVADLNARGELARNRVSGVDVGLLVYFDGRDFVRIGDNEVGLRPEGSVGISCQANHTYLVERNTVTAAGANPDGIVLWGTDPVAGINGSVVWRNRVVLDGSEYGGISLVGGGASNVIAQNRVEGSAAYALGLVADFSGQETVSTGNLLVANRISRFTPRDSGYYGTGAHVFFDANTRANLFVGMSGTVKDLGQDNVFRSLDGQRQALSEARAARRRLVLRATRW